MTEHVSGRRRVAGGLAAMVVGGIALVGAFPSAANATGGGGLPEHPCPDDGWDFHWGPENQDEVPGEHTDGDFTVTISNVRTEEERRTFDFETSVPVEFLFAVGFPDRDEGVAHEYDPPVTEGTASTGDPQYIKHVYFCPAPEAPTTTESTTTTTEAPTTTSTVPPSTAPTTPSTETTSTEPTTTSTVPPSSEAPTTAPPTTQPASDEELPKTGSTTMPLVAGAGALLAVGVALVVGRRYLQNRAAS